jgi:hypothetical protein
MFSFLVEYNVTAWETDDLMRMVADRFNRAFGGGEA